MLNVLWYLLTTVEVMCTLLLVVVILAQRTKSQGMGMAFGAQMGENLFGAQMGNVLTRTTVVLGLVFLINTTFLALIAARMRPGSVADSIKSTPAASAVVPQAGQPIPAAPGQAPAMPSAAMPAETAVPAPAPEVEPAAAGTPAAAPMIDLSKPAAAPAAAPVAEVAPAAPVAEPGSGVTPPANP